MRSQRAHLIMAYVLPYALGVLAAVGITLSLIIGV